MELSSSSQNGKTYQNIEVGGHARVLFGDYIDSGSFLNGRPDFTGSYAHSSLRPVASYVSRPDLERKICEQLSFETDDQSVNGECRVVIVWGLGGAGKSQLILNYIRGCRQHYRAVFWIEAGRKETIERDYIQIYKLLFPNRTRPEAKIAVEDAVTAIKNWFSGQQREERCLWVMDSADDVEHEDSPSYVDLHHYLPSSSQLDCIVTTRSSSAQALSLEAGIAVAELSEGEAVLLFKKQAKLQQVERECEEEIRAIVKELGYLALAVTLAASYVGKTPCLASHGRQYLPQYRAQQRQLLSRKAHRHIHQYDESVFGTWEVSFAAIQRQSPLAAKLLSLLGFINSDDIFLDLFSVSSTVKLPDEDTRGAYGTEWWHPLSRSAAAIDEFEIETAFGLLQAYSLVSWRSDQTAYTMHRLVHTWTSERLDKPQKRRLSLAALQILVQFIDSREHDVRTKVRVVPHAMASFTALNATSELDNRASSHQLESIDKIGMMLYNLGHWNYALSLYKYVRRASELTHGFEHPFTLYSMHNLACALRAQGHYQQAEDLHRRVVELSKKVLGREHPSTLSGMVNLAVTLTFRCEYEQAKVIYRQVLGRMQRQNGIEHLDTQVGIRSFVEFLMQQGMYKEAEKVNEELLIPMRNSLGSEHPEAIRKMAIQARIMYYRRQYLQGDKLLGRVLALQEKVFGLEHLEALAMRHLLALSLWKQGKPGRAEILLSQIIVLSEKVLGSEHPETLARMDSLTPVLRDLGKYQLAVNLAQNLVQTRRRIFGVDHVLTLASMSSLSRVLHPNGEYASAEKIGREVLNLKSTRFGPKDPDTLISLNNLARILGKQGRLKEEEKLYRQAANITEIVLGSKHHDTLLYTTNLAIAMEDQGDYEGAEVLIRSVLDMRTDVLGPQHPDTLDSMGDLAEVLCEQGKFDESEQKIRQILGLRKTLLQPNHPDTLTILSNLASVLCCKGNYEQAEVLLRQVLELRREVLGSDHPDTLFAKENLTDFLSSQGRKFEAEDSRRQKLELKTQVLDIDRSDAENGD